MQTTVTTSRRFALPSGAPSGRQRAAAGRALEGGCSSSSPDWCCRHGLITLVFVYGFILWTLYLSFTRSRGIPARARRLAQLPARSGTTRAGRWRSTTCVFGSSTSRCAGLGVLIAILLDQRIRQEGALRAIYLYPMASPSSSQDRVEVDAEPGAWAREAVQGLGLRQLQVRLDHRREDGIYTVVIAGVWQPRVLMAMFLAGLRASIRTDQGRLHRRRLPAAHLPPLIIPQLRRCSLGGGDPGPPGHQELRARGRAHRAARLRDRDAVDLHVRPHLHSQSAGWGAASATMMLPPWPPSWSLPLLRVRTVRSRRE